MLNARELRLETPAPLDKDVTSAQRWLQRVIERHRWTAMRKALKERELAPVRATREERAFQRALRLAKVVES